MENIQLSSDRLVVVAGDGGVRSGLIFWTWRLFLFKPVRGFNGSSVYLLVQKSDDSLGDKQRVTNFGGGPCTKSG